MNRFISIAAFIGAISLAAMPASACGTIQKVWFGFNAAWAPTLGNTIWFLCSDNSAYYMSVGAINNNPAAGPIVPNEQGLGDLLGSVLFAKGQQCTVLVSGNGVLVTAVECDN